VSDLNTPALTLLLDLRTAARALSISPRTLHALAVRGEIKSVRIGRRRLFALDDLREYVGRQKV
jgi:excisionase family DNA binding protein